MDINLLALRSGDRVLATMRHDDVTPEQLEEFKTKLEQRFPGVEFTVVTGVSTLAHMAATEREVDQLNLAGEPIVEGGPS